MNITPYRADLGQVRNYILTEGSLGARFVPDTKLSSYFMVVYKSYTADFDRGTWLLLVDKLEELIIFFFDTFVKDGQIRFPRFKWFSIGIWVIRFVKDLVEILNKASK